MAIGNGWIKRLIAAIVLLASCQMALADTFPSKRISIIAPYAPGAPYDLLLRLFSEQLRQKLGVPVIVENVQGGQGIIAYKKTLNAAPDGYTLLFSSPAVLSLPKVSKSADYSADDFVAIGPLGQVPFILFVNEKIPANNIKSFMAYAKQAGSEVDSGVLMVSHLSILLSRKLALESGANEFTEVGFRGSADMIRALISGDIDIMTTTHSVASPHLATGRMKAIGVLSDSRTNKLPEVATFKEAGYPDIKMNAWAGLFGNAKIPQDVLRKIRQATKEIVENPGFAKLIEPTGMERWDVSFDDLPSVLAKETDQFVQDAKKFKIQVD